MAKVAAPEVNQDNVVRFIQFMEQALKLPTMGLPFEPALGLRDDDDLRVDNLSSGAFFIYGIETFPVR